MPRERTYYGPSLVGGEIRYLSVSQVERFDRETEGGCPRKWYFRHVARIPEPQRKPQKLGEQVHSQIEHYLKTGKDVLGEVARPGKRFLPRPGPDLVVEEEFAHLADTRAAGDHTLGPVRSDRIESLLHAADVPVIGYVDVAHARGEWVDDAGEVRTEPGTAEVIDHKTTGRIEDRVDADGTVVERGWAKSGEALARTWQMSGYGVVALARWPGVRAVRLSHCYYQTRGARAASKRSVLVAAEDVVARWRRSGQVVEEMRAVARATRPEDVPANLSACGAYGGCSYRAQCPRDPAVVLGALFGAGRAAREGQRMASVLDQIRARAKEKGKAVAPPPTAAPSRAEVEAEKAKVLVEERAARGGVAPPDAPAPKDTHEPVPPEAPPEVRKFAERRTVAWKESCGACGAEVTPDNGSKLTDGTVRHVGCPKDAKPALDAACALAKDLMIVGEGKLNGGQMVSVPTSEFRGSEPGRTVGGGGPPLAMREPTTCIPPGQRELTTDEAVDKKVACPCGEVIKVKPRKMDGRYFALVPAHAAKEADVKIRVEQADGSMQEHKIDNSPSTMEEAHVRDLTPAEKLASGRDLSPSERDAVVSVLAKSGFDLYLDCYPDGVAVQRLDAYADALAEGLCREYGAADVRCAPKDSPLAYGGWKGALAASARAQLPPPGAYVASSANEVALCVLDAIAPSARVVVRGVGR